MNGFIKAATMDAGANNACTENGAISYATIGNEFLNQFSKAGSYRGRDLTTVWAEQSRLWAEDSEKALKFPFYLRMITRKTNVMGKGLTERVQRGSGARDESFKRLLWIAKYHPEEFYRNLWILPIIGSWKDLWVLLASDDAETYLEKDKFFNVMAQGIMDSYHKELVKKYLPRIRSTKKCHTDWATRTNTLAKEFAEYVGWTYTDYRQFKSTGNAHKFQRIICGGLYDNIDWKTIPGKALLNLVSGKFLENHNLSKNYINWIKSQPVAKFNGYAYELGRKLDGLGYGKNLTSVSLATKITVDKQFQSLIATASDCNGSIEGNVLCAMDTSGSMDARVSNNGVTAFDVCVGLGIYFSELNKGAFHNVVAMFDNVSELKSLKGSFSDKWFDIKASKTAWGGTNFQSLIDLIVKVRKEHPEIPISEMPSTLLVISDMQFNPSNTWHFNGDAILEKTNYEAAMEKLRSVFPEEFVKNFKIIWWNVCNGRSTDFPSTMDDAGTYFFSGFDGATISFLLGGDEIAVKGEGGLPSAEDVARAALEQEVLQLVI